MDDKETLRESIINFPTAKLANEKGFPKLNIGDGYSTDGKYADDMFFGTIAYEAPTQAILAKWLRDKHHLHIELIWDLNFGLHWYCVITKIGDLGFKLDLYDVNEKNKILVPEKAFEQGLQAALNLIP